MQDTTDHRPNGVDIDTLVATIDAVRQQPEAARFRFRAVNEWVSGTHSRGRLPGFFGAGREHLHAVPGVEGDVDLRGILGIDPAVRNGFSDIRVVSDIDADADSDAVAALVTQSGARSAVFDVLTHGTTVDIEVARR